MAAPRIERRGPPRRDQTTSPASPQPAPPAALANATTELNAALERAEKAFQKLDLGVTAEVILDDESQEVTDLLSFRKHGSAWRLMWMQVDHDERVVEAQPITSAPRWVRVAAGAKMVELHRRALEAASKELSEVQRAIAAVDEFVGQVAPEIIDEEIPF